MATLNELSYRIFSIVVPSIGDDQSIDIAEIQYDIENTRAMLIKRSFSNKPKMDIPEAIIQPINKLEIESINASRVGLPSSKVVMKTVLTVPQILEKSSGLPLIKRISASTLLSTNFTISTPQQAIYSGNGKFNSQDIFCFYESGYLYFVTGRDIFKGIKYIDLHAVFSKPTDVYQFLNTNYNESCDNNSYYPISSDMVEDIEQIILKKLRIESSQPIDAINDSSDTTKQVNVG